MSTVLLIALVGGLAYGVKLARVKTYTIPYLKISVGPAVQSPPAAS